MTGSKVCGYDIDSPVKIGRNVTAGRTHCKNRTTHESGRCHLHRRRWEASNA